MVIVAFPPGEKYAVNYTTLDQYDYGQILRIQGLKLPKTVEVHFSTQETGGTSITRVGVTKDGVTDVLIPDSVLENGDTTQNYSIFAFVYITDATSGKTEYRAKLEVKARPKPEVPGGSDNPDVFRDAVLAVRESALKAEEDAKKTTEDRKAVEHAVESVKDITEQVARVEELSRNAQEAATQTQNAAQGIITDREQINTNKEGVAQLKEDLSELSEEVGQLKQNGTGTGTGLSTEAIDKLEEVGNYLVYTTADGGSKWTELIAILRSGSSGSGSGEIVPATGISLDKTTLSFTTATTQTLIATVDPSNSTDKVTWESSNTGIATVSGGVVTPVSNGSCTITAKSGSYSASCEVTVAVESEIVTYTITNNLTNTSTDNPVTTITKNSPYEANLTPDTNHEFDSVIVTMGGVDVTSDVYTNGTIVISVVTGNVVITAIASEPQSEEVVMLKSITGDGASYIDTEFIVENNTNVFELSGTLASSTSVTLFGADGYNVETPYGNTLLKNTNQGYMHGALNYGQFSNLGTWNNSGANSLVGNRWWVVLKDGEQKIYLDAEHTKQQANATNTTATYGTGKEYVPIPLYLFTSNATSSANAKYTPCDCTIYFFKISKASGEVIHEYLPARQGTKIGMYDTVTQKFHENIGTGTFSYEEVEA